MCPPNRVGAQFTDMEFIKLDPCREEDYIKRNAQKEPICKSENGRGFRLFMCEFFATFVYVMIALTIKNSRIKLRKLN